MVGAPQHVTLPHHSMPGTLLPHCPHIGSTGCYDDGVIVAYSRIDHALRSRTGLVLKEDLTFFRWSIPLFSSR